MPSLSLPYSLKCLTTGTFCLAHICLCLCVPCLCILFGYSVPVVDTTSMEFTPAHVHRPSCNYSLFTFLVYSVMNYPLSLCHVFSRALPLNNHEGPPRQAGILMYLCLLFHASHRPFVLHLFSWF